MARAISPVDSQVDFRAVSYAASIGVAVHDRVRLGVTVSLDRLRAESLSTRHDIIVGPSQFDLRETALITNQSRVDDADTGVGLTVGAMYQPVEAISLGLVFSRGPSFKLSEDFQVDSGRAGAMVREQGALVSQPGFPKPISVNVPDQVRGGVTVRPHPRLRLAFDGTYITYSDLSRDLTPIIGHELLTADDFTINDAAEVHLGGELNVTSDRNPVWLRAGVFTNPDHRLRFVGNVQPGGNIMPPQAQRINALERARFNLGNDDLEVKGTLGGGMAIGPRLQADMAYVWKEQFVLSVGARF